MAQQKKPFKISYKIYLLPKIASSLHRTTKKNFEREIIKITLLRKKSKEYFTLQCSTCSFGLSFSAYSLLAFHVKNQRPTPWYVRSLDAIWGCFSYEEPPFTPLCLGQETASTSFTQSHQTTHVAEKWILQCGNLFRVSSQDIHLLTSIKSRKNLISRPWGKANRHSAFSSKL